MTSPWRSFDAGSTQGRQGSEGGIIARDEEHIDGARITLERIGPAERHAITCGIYGMMVHTCYFETARDAERAYEAMKLRLAQILALLPSASDPDPDLSGATHVVHRFIEDYSRRVVPLTCSPPPARSPPAPIEQVINAHHPSPLPASTQHLQYHPASPPVNRDELLRLRLPPR